MKKISAYKAGIIYFFVHMAVETICFFRLFKTFAPEDYWWMYALFYDALAFVPQIFFGILCDRFKKIPLGPIGCGMMAISLFIPAKGLSLAILSLGNALVHVEGAQVTLRGAGGRMGPSGIFVAGGSFGVAAGRILGTFYPEAGFYISLTVIAAAMIITAFVPKKTDYTLENNKKYGEICGFGCAEEKISQGAVIGLMFFTVAARSYVGYAIPTGWNKETWQTIMLFCCMAVGKALGGIAADRFGAGRTGFWTLIAAIPLLIFGDKVMTVSLFGVLLFSMTMPISLGILVSLFDDSPGFCFGITTVGLFVGSLPSFFYKPEDFVSQAIILSVLSASAALCFFICGKKNGIIFTGRGNPRQKEEKL